jgi:hypothetical protein
MMLRLTRLGINVMYLDSDMVMLDDPYKWVRARNPHKWVALPRRVLFSSLCCMHLLPPTGIQHETLSGTCADSIAAWHHSVIGHKTHLPAACYVWQRQHAASFEMTHFSCDFAPAGT